ncbi:MAG: flagellar hook-basal body protein [Ruminococcus sp.]|nr:flagellar hook-basal body protein [Ruminococcus sp.]
MNNAFYIGASGLKSYQYDIDVIAHNVSNVSTDGYKATSTDFRDLMYSALDINKNRGKEVLDQNLLGRGVKVMGQDMLYTQGVLKASEYDLDFAITGDGLFEVDHNGETYYTRNGSFDISVEEDGNWLVTSEGAYVHQWNGEHIPVPYVMNEDGTYSSKVDLETLTPSIAVYMFDNPQGLERRDGTKFLPTELSGEPRFADDSSEILNHYTENSNVDLAKEMSDLIVTQKAYQFSARIVTTADQLEETINSLR